MTMFVHLRNIVFGVFLLVLYCEVLIYYIVLIQCSWPFIEKELSAYKFESDYQPLKVMLLADPHLLGPFRGHWFDKLRREWQMFRTFQTSMMIHIPDVVFILGDLFDEGLWSNEEQFQTYVNRFHSLFSVHPDTKLYVVPGNHDMGFHYWIREDLRSRFENAFNTTPVQMASIHESVFVLINSMAMEGDGCSLCESASDELHKIATTLNHNKKHADSEQLEEYGRPILLQHFPMYRKSDSLCNEPDSPPSPIKQEHFREKWDCLSKATSEKIFKLLKPRVIFSGHTHYGCHVVHKKNIHEWTIPSFSWRNHKSPSFTMAVFTPHKHAISKCYMPQETTVIWTYIIGGILLLIWTFFNRRKLITLGSLKSKTC